MIKLQESKGINYNNLSIAQNKKKIYQIWMDYLED